MDDRLEAGYRIKRFGKTQSRWWKQQGTTWGDNIKESEEMQIEALKEAYEELKYGEENMFHSDPRRRDNISTVMILCR